MYSRLQICTKTDAEMVSRQSINLLSHAWLLKMIKNGQFSILSFSNDSVSPINLISAVIINYQLSIEGNALELTVAIFLFTRRLRCRWIIKKVSLCTFLSLSQVADCETTRTVSRLTLSDMYARAESSLCLRPFLCKKKCIEQKQ